MTSSPDLAALHWSTDCNARGIGFLGPTVKRLGPLPELAHLVAEGLLRCEEDIRLHGRRDADSCGYWITDAGRALLALAGDTSGGVEKIDISSVVRAEVAASAGVKSESHNPSEGEDR